jgi:methylated-DNA-protein-cysteine methyltransferase-like protein
MRKRRVAGHAYTSPPIREVFHNLVWDVVSKIPRGKVTTYGAIGSMIDRPKGIRARYYNAVKARWVGSALAACPPGLPWHRVINAQGKVSVRSGNDHHKLQKRLLEKEGVKFDEKGKVALSKHFWVGGEKPALSEE